MGILKRQLKKDLLLLQDEELHAKFRENGFNTAKEKFHSSEIVEQYEELYYEVAGK